MKYLAYYVPGAGEMDDDGSRCDGDAEVRELEAMKHVSACTFPFFEKLSVVASLVNNLSLN